MTTTVFVKSSYEQILNIENTNNRNIRNTTVIRKIRKCPCKINYQNAQSYINKLESKIEFDRKRADKERNILVQQMKYLKTKFRSLELKFDNLLKGQLVAGSPVKEFSQPIKVSTHTSRSCNEYLKFLVKSC